MEEARFPIPFEMQEVTGIERAEASALVEAAEHAAYAAEFGFRGTDGDYFLHLADVVETVGDADSGATQTVELEREAWAGSNYMVTDATGHSATAAVAEDGKSVTGEAAEAVAAAAAAIDSGQARGAHRLSTVKHLEGEAGAVVMSIEITHTSGGQLFPTTAVDLRLLRTHNEGGGMIMQGCRIVSDPNTGSVSVGDSLIGEQWVREGGGQLLNKAVRVTDPLPEMTAADLQGQFYPPTPLNSPPDSYSWSRLITQPIDPSEQLWK